MWACRCSACPAPWQPRPETMSLNTPKRLVEQQTELFDALRSLLTRASLELRHGKKTEILPAMLS